MQQIGHILGQRKVGKTPDKALSNKALSKRSDLIRQFLERLNEGRGNGKYNLLSPAFISMKMSHLDTWDLEIFLGQCKEAKNFSSYWWWALEDKK